MNEFRKPILGPKTFCINITIPVKQCQYDDCLPGILAGRLYIRILRYIMKNKYLTCKKRQNQKILLVDFYRHVADNISLPIDKILSS